MGGKWHACSFDSTSCGKTWEKIGRVFYSLYIYATEYLFVVWLKFKVYFINDKLSIYHVDVGNLVTFAALGGMCNLVLVQQ